MQFKEPTKKYPNPFIKYNGFVIEKVQSDKYPELVNIIKAPKPAIHMFGKKYIAIDYAIKAVDVYNAERIIVNGKDTAYEEMADIGLDPDETVLSDDE